MNTKQATIISLNPQQLDKYKHLIGTKVKTGKHFYNGKETTVEVFTKDNERLLVNINRLKFDDMKESINKAINLIESITKKKVILKSISQFINEEVSKSTLKTLRSYGNKEAPFPEECDYSIDSMEKIHNFSDRIMNSPSLQTKYNVYLKTILKERELKKAIKMLNDDAKKYFNDNVMKDEKGKPMKIGGDSYNQDDYKFQDYNPKKMTSKLWYNYQMKLSLVSYFENLSKKLF